MSDKVIVFGGAGQLGLELCQEFSRRNWNVISYGREAVDITNPTRVSQVIGQEDPKVVVNAAAYNQVDIAESDPLTAYQVNALAVRNIAVACRQSDTFFVHFSTDYVFDGHKNAPYVETDTPHPLGAYGVSKLAGEMYAQAYLDHCLVLRTSGVFGPGGLFTPRGNFVELMLRLAQSGNPIRVVEDHSASPSYAPAMATRTLDLIERGLTGVIHLGGGEPISWYAYARMIFELAGCAPVLQATNEREYRTAARRPKFSALANERLQRAGIAPMPPLREALQAYLALRPKATSHRSA